jgi:hypothetical protein
VGFSRYLLSLVITSKHHHHHLRTITTNNRQKRKVRCEVKENNRGVYVLEETNHRRNKACMNEWETSFIKRQQ